MGYIIGGADSGSENTGSTATPPAETGATDSSQTSDENVILDESSEAGSEDASEANAFLDNLQAKYDSIDASIRALIEGLQDMGIPDKQIPSYIVTAALTGQLDDLAKILGIEINTDAIVAFAEELTGLLGKAVSSLLNLSWAEAFTYAVIALNTVKWFGNLIFGGPPDSYEAFRAESGTKSEYEAWRKDAKRRNFWQRLEKWVGGRFGATAGAAAARLGPIGIIAAVIIHVDHIRGSATAVEDGIRRLLGGKDRQRSSDLALPVDTKLSDWFNNEFVVTKSGKDGTVKILNDSKWLGMEADEEIPFYVDTRSGEYSIRIANHIGRYLKSIPGIGGLFRDGPGEDFRWTIEPQEAVNANRGGMILAPRHKSNNVILGGY